MKRISWISFVAGLALLAAAVPAVEATSHEETNVAGAGTGALPSGTTFLGIPVSGATFAVGVQIESNGGAQGDLLIVLAGTSLAGQPQDVTLEGEVTGGVLNAPGDVTFSGTGLLNLGAGVPPTSVPFVVAATRGGLALTIAGAQVPVLAPSSGSIDIG